MGAMRRSAAVLAAAVLAAYTAAAVFAERGREQIRLNPADQAAARATILRRSDLRPPSGWSGGRVKPDLSPVPTCPNYHPKQSDLVLTGAAESGLQRRAVAVDSEVQVLRTRRMVTLDWRREVLAPGAVSCLRRTLGRTLGPFATVVSFERIPLPRVARYTAEFRARIDVRVPGGKTARLILDSVLIGRKRSEITLTMTAPASARAALSAAERRLARTLAGRARA